MQRYTHSNGFAQIVLLLLGVVILAGLAAWSLAVLPNQSKQDRLGASIEQGISGLLQEEQGSSAATEVETVSASEQVTLSNDGAAPSQEQAVELPKEGVIPVFVEPANVTPGGKVQVTVGVPDLIEPEGSSEPERPASVRSVEIFLESPSGLQTSQTNIWNINGEGQWFDHISIPQDAELGRWKVKTIEITDTEGNITSYSFGTDIFSTFRVE